jgi:hypothetical protein
VANKYLYSGAAGAATGADWANAYLTIAAAAAGMAAGDDLWVASDHNESTAGSVTANFPGTFASPNRIISVSRAGSTPPVAADVLAGARITNTTAANIVVGGSFYAYGLTLNNGTGASATSLRTGNNTGVQVWENCSFNLLSTSASSFLVPANVATSWVDWINCSVSFANTGQGLQSATATTSLQFRWRNKSGSTAITGATIPTNLFTSSARGYIELSGLDLSALGSGKTITAAAGLASFLIQNCSLGLAGVVAATPTSYVLPATRLIGCNSSASVERNEIYHYSATLTTETTIIRTAGASDGTTAYSWKIVSTANASRVFPFETFEGVVWNTTTGSSKTLTFHCVTDNVTLTNADIWLEVEYLGSSGTPVTTLVSSAPATQLTAGSNLTSDSGEAWTTTGLVTPLKQKFSVSFTPQMAGPIRWKVKVAKASTTVYVDPNPDLT